MHATFLDTVFNLPNNVEVLMEVSSESNIDGSTNEQNASGNENNNNARKLTCHCVLRDLARKTMIYSTFSILQAEQTYFRLARHRRHISCETSCRPLPDTWFMVVSLPRL